MLSKWLPGTAFGEKDKEAEPKILLGAAGHGMGRDALSVPVGWGYLPILIFLDQDISTAEDNRFCFMCFFALLTYGIKARP